MRVLVTGASGLIGTALTDRLCSSGNEVYCQSRNIHDVCSGVTWVKHDLINDSWSQLSLPEFDLVYHLAGQTSSYSARQNPLNDLATNVVGLLHLLEYLKGQQQLPVVVIAGTATEVGLTDQLPINERMSDNPITFYDISKLTAEMYLKQYIREGWIKGCSLRLANVFGRSQTGQQKDRGIIDKVFSRAVTGQNITIYGDGNYLRDYIFIDDAVSALVLAVEHLERTNGCTFYIGSGIGISLKTAFSKVIALAERITDSRVVLEHANHPADLLDIEYRNAIIDPSAFRYATGWTPQYDFDSGLEAAYKYVLARKVLM